MIYYALSTSYLWLQRNKAIVVLCSIGVRKTLDIVGQQGSILSSVDIFHLCNSLHVFLGGNAFTWFIQSFGIGPFSRVHRGSKLRFLESHDLKRKVDLTTKKLTLVYSMSWSIGSLYPHNLEGIHKSLHQPRPSHP